MGVNVLEVMDDAALEFDCQCGHPSCSRQRDKERITEARAAVAELIEAAEACREAWGVDATYMDLREAHGRLAAALARCNGGAA